MVNLADKHAVLLVEPMLGPTMFGDMYPCCGVLELSLKVRGGDIGSSKVWPGSRPWKSANFDAAIVAGAFDNS